MNFPRLKHPVKTRWELLTISTVSCFLANEFWACMMSDEFTEYLCLWRNTASATQLMIIQVGWVHFISVVVLQFVLVHSRIRGEGRWEAYVWIAVLMNRERVSRAESVYKSILISHYYPTCVDFSISTSPKQRRLSTQWGPVFMSCDCLSAQTSLNLTVVVGRNVTWEIRFDMRIKAINGSPALFFGRFLLFSALFSEKTKETRNWKSNNCNHFARKLEKPFDWSTKLSKNKQTTATTK